MDKFCKMNYIASNAIKTTNSVVGGGKKAILTFPIPFAGAGIHVWGGFKFGKVSLLSAGKGVP